MTRDWRSWLPWRRKEAQSAETSDRSGKRADASARREGRPHGIPALAAPARHQRCRRCCARWTRCRASSSCCRSSPATAYADQAMPIACGQTISQPYVVAYMTEQLEVKRDHRVLEVGTGSGYQAAMLSPACRRRCSPSSATARSPTRARETLARLGYDNVTVIAGDGLNGRAGARALRPHHRHGGGRERSRRRWSTSWPTAACMLLPLGQHDGAAAHRQADARRRTASTRSRT